MDVSLALVGGTVGGPAKVAVFASALFGCVSGHSVANVYGTGTFTIPLMKKAGYPPEYAGAVEAAASTGGQIMPPIMGAAAFLMAEFLGVSYLAVCKAAIFPALLYFLALFAATHFRARKMNLAKIGRDNLPDMKSTLFNGYHFLLPMVVLIGVLVLGYTPFRAAFLAIVALLAVASARKSSRLSFVQFVQTLVLGARSALTIAACCGCAGIIVGALDITGVGIKFVEVVMIASRGVFSLSLVLVMLACLVLGMGIPTAPAYIIVSLIAVPALIKMGILPIAAHMFVFYSCLLSAITPPVGLAAYAGAAIAGAPVMRTCVLASVLGVVIYIVPYVFVYNPALLLEGSTPFIIISVISATVGVIGLSAALERYAVTKLSPLQLVLMGGGSIMLLISNVETDVLGIIMLATGILLNNRDWKLEQKSLRIVADQAM